MPLDSVGWEATRHEPFSCEDLVAWLRTKNPSERFSFIDTRNCVWGQYTVARGGEYNISASGGCRYVIGDASIPVGFGIQDWRCGVVNVVPYTFGRVLARAEAHLVNQKELV